MTVDSMTIDSITIDSTTIDEAEIACLCSKLIRAGLKRSPAK